MEVCVDGRTDPVGAQDLLPLQTLTSPSELGRWELQPSASVCLGVFALAIQVLQATRLPLTSKRERARLSNLFPLPLMEDSEPL